MYRKIYPSKLNFELKGITLHVYFSGRTHYNPDLWGIKYLFDKGMANLPAKIFVDGIISKTMALRIYFLESLFPNIEFHDADEDKYIVEAEKIISNIGTEYVTYKSCDHALDGRGTKDKPESRIERELADNLSKYLPDFSVRSKVIRQFPANIFRNSISEETRVTDKLWIDMVSVNDADELSPIELKVGGNIPLDLFAQGLDYGIYCHLFKGHIRDNWFNGHSGTAQDKVTIYYVGEEFHPALVGRNGEKGVISLIRKNKLFNIVFIKITVDKISQRIIGKPEMIFDTRKQ